MLNQTGEQISLLQKNLSPGILGIIWVTEDDLYLRPDPFNAIDYFMDGLLTKFYKEKKQKPSHIGNRKNFFVTQNFGTPFFVGHIKHSKNDIHDDLANILELTKSLDSKKKNILLINQSKANLAKDIKTNSEEYTFSEIIF